MNPLEKILDRMDERVPDWSHRVDIQMLKNGTHLHHASPPIQIWNSLHGALDILDIPNTKQNRLALLRNREKWIEETQKRRNG